ncbi:hypothetical protein PAXRUDRAFT_165071 [Paxillus rubicundulus Ve08.2h10]|uniref:DDE Tnp4 domain-containing protein n=1 Tax=Paxillus rubicundulus Ve08.2h10 TaxID=930991 RepID=A0A0D0C4J4_9AGAM|nr:hypothetical protein PAXRUDRAFT_165071 [Paxillus rubicundulus Ve08.2h10]
MTDGLKLPVQTSDDIDIENATFNGWLLEHFITSILVFSSLGIVFAARTNAPGSWHDSRVAQPIYRVLCTKTPDGYYLVADTAFPRGTVEIKGRICAPLKDGQQVMGTTDQIVEVMAFNRELLSYSQTTEWGMRAIQGSFGRLRIPLSCNDSKARGDLLEICLQLHNLHTIKVGFNQIQMVYFKHWQQTDDDIEVWTRFESMLFLDQHEKDHVA